jgi:hexosaminidase
MRLTISLLLFLLSFSVSAQIAIIPQPVSLKQPKIAAKFTISPSTIIVLEGSNLETTATFLNDYLEDVYHFRLKVESSGSSSTNAIRLNFERLDNDIEGAYLMTVDNKGVYIAGDNEPGVFYGMQTLLQLLPVAQVSNSKLPVPYCSIEDYPRFAYRGMHLDVGRHFFPVSFVKKYIDYLALHKMNYFHWHLTEDQGWRIEIKKYPKLTTVGGYRNGTIIGRYPGKGNDSLRYGGFYTQDEIKEVVKYAASRYVTIIPEIEMPGHSSAAIAAYPELSCFPGESTKHPVQCAWAGDTTGKQVQQTWGVFDDVYCAGKENTFTFLQDVIDEVVTLFPAKYIHVGGDESPKANWKRCPLCQQRMKENGLKNEHELQSYFIQRMEKYLNSKGKTLIGWDEILEGGLAPNALVMSWRGEKGGVEATSQNHTVIMTPEDPVYFDHTQSKNEDSVTIGGYNPLEKVYAYEPIAKGIDAEHAKYVFGGQANMWSEYLTNDRKVEYMLFPRMSALSEILWSPKEKRNWSDFELRLKSQFRRYDLWKANYSRAYFDLKATAIAATNYKNVLWKMETNGTGKKIRIKTEADSFYYKSPVVITRPGSYEAYMVDNNGTVLGNPVKQTFSFNKATGKKVVLLTKPSDKYPGDGAFTLVNGIQNKAKLARSSEFIGYDGGGDCSALIDLGKETKMDSLIAHILDQTASWVWPPSGIDIWTSHDGKKFSTATFTKESGDNKLMCAFSKSITARYVKILIHNQGIIPDGNPGAGSKGWLMVDEIEIK